MRTAEQRLAKTTAAPAADDQSAALDVLLKSREDFGRSIERLLVELRAELQNRLISDLTEMHELQTSIRETTQSQAPRVAQKSRTAMMTVVGTSKNEAELAERTEHLLALVEETEYGIALPTTLRILSREMRTVENWLKGADVGAAHGRPGDARRGRPAGPRPDSDTPTLARDTAAPGLAPVAGSQRAGTRDQPLDRRAQDGPDDPGTTQRRHSRRRQEPPRRGRSASCSKTGS